MPSSNSFTSQQGFTKTRGYTEEQPVTSERPATCAQHTLTAEQHAVVNAPTGHYQITAVAGSGKTTTLAYRLKHLLDQGSDPKRILVLMFNRAARQDFDIKLSKILRPNQQRPEVRTFHAMGYRLYQRFVKEGYLNAFNPQILSEKEQQLQLWRLARNLVPQEQQAELKRNKKEHLEFASSFIESVKSQLKPADWVFESQDIEAKFRYILEVFDAFEEWRMAQRRISYADMLYDTVRAIEQQPALQAMVANKMDMVLVDEYQDTNDIQHALLKYIAGTRAAVTVVGDPDQTIYEFRGAKPEYMLSQFEADFPDTSALTLSHSFRYGHQVSLLANHLITRNHGRKDILCQSHPSTPTTQATLLHCQNEAAQIIELLRGTDLSQDIDLSRDSASKQDFSDTAVLLRVWSQSISFELALLDQDLPYHMADHKGVFASEEYRALQAILVIASGGLASSPASVRQSCFFSLMRFPHLGVSEQILQELAARLGAQTQAWGTLLKEYMPSDLKKYQQNKLLKFADILSVLEKQAALALREQLDPSSAQTHAGSSALMSVKALLHYYVCESSLYEGIRSLSLNQDFAEEKIASIKAIIQYFNRAGRAPTDVLGHLYTLQQKSERMGNQGILLTTIHRAKGLEWDRVIIPGFSDRHYPYCLRSATLSNAEIESERRLLYVAMTRARQALFLVSPTKNSETKASRFEREFNLGDSLALANKIDTSKRTDLTDHEPFATKQASKVIKRYADTHGIEVCELASTQEPTQFVSESEEAVWLCEHLEHVVLGRGRVVSEGARSFSVAFEENGQEREFSKAHAQKYFTVA